VHAILSVGASMNDALLQCSAKRNDIIGTQKTELSSTKSIKQKYLAVYRSKAKFSFDVLIILANINE